MSTTQRYYRYYLEIGEEHASLDDARMEFLRVTARGQPVRLVRRTLKQTPEGVAIQGHMNLLCCEAPVDGKDDVDSEARRTQPPKFRVGDLVHYTPPANGGISSIHDEGDYVVQGIQHWGGVDPEAYWAYQINPLGQVLTTCWHPEHALALVN